METRPGPALQRQGKQRSHDGGRGAGGARNSSGQGWPGVGPDPSQAKLPFSCCCEGKGGSWSGPQGCPQGCPMSPQFLQTPFPWPPHPHPPLLQHAPPTYPPFQFHTLVPLSGLHFLPHCLALPHLPPSLPPTLRPSQVLTGSFPPRPAQKWPGARSPGRRLSPRGPRGWAARRQVHPPHSPRGAPTLSRSSSMALK